MKTRSFVRTLALPRQRWRWQHRNGARLVSTRTRRASTGHSKPIRRRAVYIIENEVQLTGTPGWSTGTKEGETSSWHLVHFIRHLPHLTNEELERMESLNPKSPDEIRQEIEAEQFLNGGDAPSPEPSSTKTHQHGDHHE